MGGGGVPFIVRTVLFPDYSTVVANSAHQLICKIEMYLLESKECY